LILPRGGLTPPPFFLPAADLKIEKPPHRLTGPVKSVFSRTALLIVIVAASIPATSGESPKIPILSFSLSNGLRVVLSEDHSAPVVAVVVCYDVGSRNEVRGRTGFAHLFEHMMFQGSENVGKAEHFKYVEGNGGILNATTYQDHTIYYNLLPSNQLELALWLESDRMRSLKITEENLKNQKEAVKEEKRLNYDNQAYWPELLKMDEMVFRNWANSHSPIGSMEDLDAATVADVKAFFDLYYAPNNAVLAIAGDIDPAATRLLAEKYFGSLPRGKTPPPADVAEPFGVAMQKRAATDVLADVPAVAIAWKIPERRTADFYPVVLLKSILCDGESARLYRKLVKETAVSLDLETTLEERRGPGQLSIVTRHKSSVPSERVLSMIEGEIDRIKREGVSEDELAKARNQFRLSRFACPSAVECTSLQSALGRAMSLAAFTLFDADPSLVNDEIDRYLSVSSEHLRQAAIRYFDRSNTAVLVISPKDAESRTEKPAVKGGKS
jgi:predicted Zn-dependent peptidase